MRPQLFLSLMAFVLVYANTSVAQPVTMEQIEAFLSQFDPADIAPQKRPYLVPNGPQIFGENVRVMYYGDNGKIREIRASKHPIAIPQESTLQETAEKFLVDHAEQIGIKPDLSELVLRPPFGKAEQAFAYYQYYQGYPVRYGSLGISITLHHQLAHLNSSLVPITEERPITFTIDRDAALQRVFEKFCMLPECNEENTRHIKTEQFVRVKDGVPYGTWQVGVGAFDGVDSKTWTVWVDGETGAIISAWEDRIF